jgi:chromosome segregation ATPase
MEIDARSIQSALDTTEEVAGLDQAALERQIEKKRERLESLNDEVEEAEKEVEAAQQALAEAEMKALEGEDADVEGAEARLSEAQKTLEERTSMLQAREETLASSIEALQEKKKAVEVRQAALTAKELNEEAVEKIRALFEAIDEVESLNAELHDICEEAWQVALDCHYPDVRSGSRRRNGLEVKALFLRAVGVDTGQGSPFSGVTASNLLDSGRAMFEDEEPQYWPSFMRE